jgi:hypothetical protein
MGNEVKRGEATQMAGFQIQPLLEKDLAEVSAFLNRSMTAMIAATRVSPLAREKTGESPSDAWQDNLLWLVDNPARRPEIPLGMILRSPEGSVAGMILTIPWFYRLKDQRLLGLAAGSFFVDSVARLQGFFLFRRYLGIPGVDFWYASSCNQQSAAIWSKSNGIQVENSDVEYLVVFRMGPLIEEAALRRQVPRPLAKSLSWAGPLAGLATAVKRPRPRLVSEPCDDWERLATIAERCRDPGRLTCERSAAYLRWK